MNNLWLGDIITALEKQNGFSNEITSDNIIKTLGFCKKDTLSKAQSIFENNKKNSNKNNKKKVPNIEKNKEQKIDKNINIDINDKKFLNTDNNPIKIEPIKNDNLNVLDLFTRSDNVKIKRKVFKFESLFNSNIERNIIITCFSTYSKKGSIDEMFILKKMAKKESIRFIPLIKKHTLNKGIQVLVDISESMEIFRNDQKSLVEVIEGIFGAELVDVQMFKDCPIRGAGKGLISGWNKNYKPIPDKPVLVLSDIGIGGALDYLYRSTKSEWIEFSKKVKKDNCFLITFVPYPKNRWPKEFLKEFCIMQWDRNIKMRDVNLISKKIKDYYK